MKHSLPVVALLVVLVTPACGFLESAAEYTFGPGEDQIPRIRQEILWPSADQLSPGSFNDEQTAGVPGFPDSLTEAMGDGTLAHLKGALDLSGDCYAEHVQEVVAAEEGKESQLSNMVVSVTSCTEDRRCASLCGDEFLGLKLAARVTILLVSEEQAAEIKDQLAEVSTDAIVQIRLQFYDLAMFQKASPDAEPENINQLLDNFQLGMDNDEGDSTVIVAHRYLKDISPETPQRFEIDNDAAFTKKLKESIFAGEPTSVNLFLDLSIPRASLYDMQIGDAGVVFEVQPEVVISVIEVAKSKI